MQFLWHVVLHEIIPSHLNSCVCLSACNCLLLKLPQALLSARFFNDASVIFSTVRVDSNGCYLLDCSALRANSQQWDCKNILQTFWLSIAARLSEICWFPKLCSGCCSCEPGTPFPPTVANRWSEFHIHRPVSTKIWHVTHRHLAVSSPLAVQLAFAELKCVPPCQWNWYLAHLPSLRITVKVATSERAKENIRKRIYKYDSQCKCLADLLDMFSKW